MASYIFRVGDRPEVILAPNVTAAKAKANTLFRADPTFKPGTGSWKSGNGISYKWFPKKSVKPTFTGQLTWPMHDMSTAPRDGTPILLNVKSELAYERWRGVRFVGHWRDDTTQWMFPAPVGHGGFPDEWFDGWHPLPPLK